MSMRTNCPTSQIAPMRTSIPPSSIDGLRDRRGAWLSAMGQPYPAAGGGPGTPPCFLDLARVCALGQAETPRESLHVGAHREAWNAEGDTEHNIGRLSPDAGQGDEVLHAARDLATEALDQRRAGRDDGFCLPVGAPGGA